MSVKDHYQNHLGNFYSWMAGDFGLKQTEFSDFLVQHGLEPFSTRVAIDLGAGHGIQSSVLAQKGYHVIAVDFNSQLLEELKQNTQGLSVEIMDQDIQRVAQFSNGNPELIVCWGDTLTHLASKDQVNKFLQSISRIVIPKGKVLLSFRDYSTVSTGETKFIPVRSDESKILTCVLEYQQEFVRVTDLLHERTATGWVQKVSSYYKVIVSPAEVVHLLEENGFQIASHLLVNGIITIVAGKH